MQESNSEAKLSDISTALSVPLQRDCSCSLSVLSHVFSCLGTEDSQTVVFLAELLYTALPGSDDLSSLLTSWVASTPPITVASTQLQVDATCPVVIDSLAPQGCSVPPPIDPPTDPPTGPPSAPHTDVTVIAVAVGVAVLVMVIIIVAIVMVVTCFCRKQSKYRYVPIISAIIKCLTVLELQLASCDVVFTACCADSTVPSPSHQCMKSMSTWTVGLGVWSWPI